MAKIVSGVSRKASSDGLVKKVEEPELVPNVSQSEDLRQKEHFFNWRAARGYISREVLKDSACGENIYGYLAQKGIFVADDRFYAKSVEVLETRAVELAGEGEFRKYKDALTPQDDIYRQFRVLRATFEGDWGLVEGLDLDRAMWGAFETCLKEYSHIVEFGSSTIDWRSDIGEVYKYLTQLISMGEETKPSE